MRTGYLQEAQSAFHVARFLLVREPDFVRDRLRVRVRCASHLHLSNSRWPLPLIADENWDTGVTTCGVPAIPVARAATALRSGAPLFMCAASWAKPETLWRFMFLAASIAECMSSCAQPQVAGLEMEGLAGGRTFIASGYYADRLYPAIADVASDRGLVLQVAQYAVP